MRQYHWNLVLAVVYICGAMALLEIFVDIHGIKLLGFVIALFLMFEGRDYYLKFRMFRSVEKQMPTSGGTPLV
jgi:hypothetical protein